MNLTNVNKEISELFKELSDMPFPKGVSELIDDLDLELIEHDAYIMGIASSYLNKNRIEIEVNKNIYIDERINESIEKLIEMRFYKQKLNELTELLIRSKS